MSILADFKNFPRVGRLLGVDWGARRIGLAISDERQVFVFPKFNVKSAEDITQVIKDENIVGIVVGLPLHSDGSESETTSHVNKFADNLALLTNLPIIFIEENLTSAEAAELAGRDKDIDSIAAALILENAIAVIKRAQ